MTPLTRCTKHLVWREKLKPLYVALLIGFSVFLTAPKAQDNSLSLTNTGQQLYAENCATCHGMDRGGYIGPGLNSERYANFPEIALAAIISAGIPGTLMPAWGKRLSTDEIAQVASFIKNNPKEELKWDMRDIRHSLEVYVADESSLPTQPTYPITNLDNLMAVMSRGTPMVKTPKLFSLMERITK
jgi:mono/diheme cytochrome c family protein